MKLLRPLTYVLVLAVGAALPVTAVVLAAPEPPPGVSMSLFDDVLQTVKMNYVKPVTGQQLLEGAIKGMIANLDPHSDYMDAAEYKDMQVQTSGEFGGLGMEVTLENGAVKIISPIDDTPAAKAGLQPNDLIIGINGMPVSGMTLTQAVNKLRGPIGSAVELLIKRATKAPFQLKLTRADIKVDPVKSKLIDHDVAYLRITSFTERTAEDLRKSYERLETESGDKLVGVVLDLRNNPGGLLDEAVGVGNEFVGRGVIVSIRGRRPEDNHVFDAQPGHQIAKGMPMVVMINGGSASASEIVAGCLKDHHRALLLGTRSFGKGSVQTILPVAQSGGAIRLTTALYYTPSGVSIQARGIKPDVVVQPARIESLPTPDIIREADLAHALKNTGSAPQTGVTTPQAPAKPVSPAVPTSENTKTAPGAKKPSAPVSQMSLFGTSQDYQLVRAVDLVRGIAMFRKVASD
jgi:carboxyl-terminal processing protease